MIVATENNDLPGHIRRDGKQGYDILYNKYAPTLYGMIFRMVNNTSLAEALLEESLLKICSDIDSYDAEKCSFFTWSSRITRGIVQKTLNKASAARAESAPAPHDDCPEVIRLVFWNRISVEETARIMNISVSNVKACLRKDLKKVNSATK